jgi:hypothetical protein
MLPDRDRAPQPPVAYGATLFVLLGIVRLYRVLWAFKNLMFIMIRPDQNRDELKTPAIEDSETVSPR